MDHHRGRSAQPPCQAAPSHGQPGQATAERAAQRRRPNGGVRPEAHTFDTRVMAFELPTSGTALILVGKAALGCAGRGWLRGVAWLRWPIVGEAGTEGASSSPLVVWAAAAAAVAWPVISTSPSEPPSLRSPAFGCLRTGRARGSPALRFAALFALRFSSIGFRRSAIVAESSEASPEPSEGSTASTVAARACMATYGRDAGSKPISRRVQS